MIKIDFIGFGNQMTSHFGAESDNLETDSKLEIEGEGLLEAEGKSRDGKRGSSRDRGGESR